jgi:hypothetical protein
VNRANKVAGRRFLSFRQRGIIGTKTERDELPGEPDRVAGELVTSKFRCRGLTATEADRVLAETLNETAARLAGRNANGERLLERDLDHEIRMAGMSRWTRGRVELEGARRNYPFEGWRPLPGGPDIVFYDGDDPLLILENKWSLDGDNVFEVANDLFKLTAAYSWDRFVGGYLVVGAPIRLWNLPTICADWFPPAHETRSLDALGWINTHAELWSWIRAHSAGRPMTAPAAAKLTGVAVIELDIAGKVGGPEPWQLRCTRVSPRPGTTPHVVPS